MNKIQLGFYLPGGFASPSAGASGAWTSSVGPSSLFWVSAMVFLLDKNFCCCQSTIHEVESEGGVGSLIALLGADVISTCSRDASRKNHSRDAK